MLGKKEDIGVFEGCLIPQCTLWTSVNGWINFCMNLNIGGKILFLKKDNVTIDGKVQMEKLCASKKYPKRHLLSIDDDCFSTCLSKLNFIHRIIFRVNI